MSMFQVVRWFWVLGVLCMVGRPFVLPLGDEMPASLYDWLMLALAALVGGATGISLFEFALWRSGVWHHRQQVKGRAPGSSDQLHRSGERKHGRSEPLNPHQEENA